MYVQLYCHGSISLIDIIDKLLNRFKQKFFKKINDSIDRYAVETLVSHLDYIKCYFFFDDNVLKHKRNQVTIHLPKTKEQIVHDRCDKQVTK
jgi:hypothetical protein